MANFLGGLTPEMILNLVLGRFDQSLNHHRRFFRKTRDFYNLYRCVYTGERPPFKNVVMLPLLLSACWSDVANKAAISLGGQRIIEMDAVSGDEVLSAKRAEALTNRQMFDMDILEKMIDFLMCANVYGTGILQYGWRREQMPAMYRRQIFGIEYEDKAIVTTFDGPDIEIVDPLDFLPQVGQKTIPKMAYACRRYWKDLDDLEEQAYAAMQRGEQPEFDPNGLAQLRNMMPGQGTTSDLEERQNVWRSWSQYQAQRQEKYAKPVELIDMIGLVPKEYSTDGMRFRIMTVGNRMVPLRNVPSPHWSLKKHFRAYSPMPDMHFFHGIGKIEPVATLAASANKLVSNRLDVLDLALQPAMFASDSTELDTQNLVLWPGRVIKVHGETGDTAIRPVQFNLEAYGLVVNELETISRYIDMATGVQRDTIQGMLSGDRQTAREFLGRMEQARTRLGLEAKLFERAVIEGLADDIRMLDRQFLEMPRMIDLIGSDALRDPDSGEMLPPESPMKVELKDINANHRIRAVGASNMLSKSMKRQDFITAMQAIGSIPGAMERTNWIAFLSKFWRAFEENPSEMIIQPKEGSPESDEAIITQGEGEGAPEGDMLEQLSGMTGAQQTAPVGLMSALGAAMQQNVGQ
jgi:hypothetical protein